MGYTVVLVHVVTYCIVLTFVHAADRSMFSMGCVVVLLRRVSV